MTPEANAPHDFARLETANERADGVLRTSDGIGPLPSETATWAVPIVHHQAVMLGMRLTEIWLWPQPFADVDATRVALRYGAAFDSPPKWQSGADWFEWDGDPWWINAVGHSLFGSELYLAARRCRFEPWGAFALATLGSAAWEYGYEASGVRPSALDLVYTPVSGLVLGELRHYVFHHAAGLGSEPLRVLLQTLMDPAGSIERSLGSPC